MNQSRKIGLYVSYYLAKFDKVAYLNLGFGNQLETHKKIGKLLAVNPNTVKNWRDEFDPLFGNRAGWYQRPLSPSRVREAQAFEDLDEPHILEIVKDILKYSEQGDSEALEQLVNIVNTDDTKEKKSNYILRTPTGKAAELFFIDYFKNNQKPIEGTLIDCRDFGVGYDFRIEGNNSITYIEVKGISDFAGGILFTDKEWSIAQKDKENYYVCIVSNLNSLPDLNFIQNPAENLNPQKNIYTSIQISWSVNQNQLVEKYDKLL
jgi:hypothetical protein